MGRLRKGAISTDSSTLSHDWVVELGEVCELSGIQFLEAPVTDFASSVALMELEDRTVAGVLPERSP